MCVSGPLYTHNWKYQVDGFRRTVIFHEHKLRILIPRGSSLRIGIMSRTGNSSSYMKETVIGELSHFNIWDSRLTSEDIFKMTRGCHTHTGNVISWSVVQFWLLDSVTKTSPSSCTSAGILFYFIFKQVEMSPPPPPPPPPHPHSG